MFAARKTDGAATAAANYIEDVFSTYLYTGNGSVQTIPNSIALGSAYGGSVYFDGTGDYLRTASTTAAAFGTGDFTMEVWANPTTTPSVYRGILSTYDGSTGAIIEIINGEFAFWVGTHTLSGVTATLGSWAHLALTRSGTTVRFFVNGVLRNTELAHTTNYSSSPITVGAIDASGSYDFNGYISNARIIKGSALYTATFTPPVAPLTPVSGTSFLTCQSPSPTTDYSSNALSITVNGNAVAQNGGGPFTDSTANKGGMVWLKSRSAATDHALYDTARGATFDLASNLSTAQTTQTTGLTSFNSNGFSIGSLAKLNTNAATYTSWTFRKQAKFFDVVTYTGDGTLSRQIPHSLGAIPGCMIIRQYGAASTWWVYHRGNTSPNTNWWHNYLSLNSTGATAGNTSEMGEPTSTYITTGNASTYYNNSGATYLVYLFAHDAGGFGAAGTDNVISCGSYTGTGASGNTITLGYEPQWVLIKRSAGGTGNWIMHDTMRGMPTGGTTPYVIAEAANAEASSSNFVDVTSTGFQIKTTGSAWNSSGSTYIYIAIRRGPMKTPTSGTSVFTPAISTQSWDSSTNLPNAGFPADALFSKIRDVSLEFSVLDRFRGGSLLYITTAAETGNYINWGASQTIPKGGSTTFASAAYSFIWYYMRRAPGFFDVVCDTGTASAHTITHGLTVVPELMIRKKRNSATNSDWVVWHTAFTGTTKYLYLNSTAAEDNNSAFWTSTAPTSTVFSVGTGSRVNNTGDTYVTYLFASVNGVSKVGSYTGNGSSQTINCGFAAGARFILIKRTSSTGNWVTFDTARGIVSGNDPALYLNSTAAEVTGIDAIDPDNSGFIVNQETTFNLNVNAATYIYLAIA